ncbi:unnamed protein product [Ambrosiozyma monospora]|uniref:Unnamed protein product n=1 Tax=Ambrosiozyma monospora TaxID=43982 RepID=A0ACB5TDP9_AMBMO|nr:unnamed protein product [Ambrosiozyma monospora]
MSTPEPEIRLPRQRKFIKSPDFKVRDAKLAELNDSLKKLEADLSAVNKDIEKAVTPPELVEQRKKLLNELNTVKREQSDIKNKRNQIGEQIKAIDAIMKKKIGDINAVTSKNNFKNADDIEKRIQYLDDLIGKGDLRIVEERKFVKEITSLRKLKKDFASVEQEQKSIDADKAKIAELKKTQSGFNNREAQAKFEEVTKKLDEISAKNKGVQDKRDTLYNKRRALYKQKDEIYAEIKAIRADFDKQFQKFKADMDAERKRREEEEKAYRLSIKKKQLTEDIEIIRESSKNPAFTQQIANIETLLVHFDPTYVKTEKPLLQQSKGINHVRAVKTVAMPASAVIIKKEPESFFSGSNSKKGKKHKGKKGGKFALEPTLISMLSELAISLPTSQADTENTVAELKKQLNDYKAKQAEQTKANVAKGEEKIKKLQEQIDSLESEIEEELAKEKAKRGSEHGNHKKEEKKEEKEEEEEEKTN